MPERVFKYNTVPELVGFAKSIAQALVNGSTKELKNSHTGFLISTASKTPGELKAALLDVRYEIYLRGRGCDGNAGDDTAAGYEPKDPRQEKIMHVAPNRSNGNWLYGGQPWYFS